MFSVVETAAFDWRKRGCGLVLTLPFIEGVPSAQKAQEINRWVRSHSDRYRIEWVKFYHGTDPSLAIEVEGLKPTSATRRRSYQSRSGYVYLANTPERAETFGRLGNSGRCLVYEVAVPVRSLRADRDQLGNLCSTGVTVGNSIGESIVYGGGVRIKGRIEPFAVRRYS
jgi:hypothetical protein